MSCGAKVVTFSVEQEDAPNAMSPRSDCQDMVLVLTLETQLRPGITSEIKSKIKTKYTGDSTAGIGNGWNY
jgi:hypothetical protein